jgi:hypothetical protein
MSLRPFFGFYGGKWRDAPAPDAARARAESLGRNLSAHLDALIRADLAGAGLPVPPPLLDPYAPRRRDRAEAVRRRPRR